MSHPSCSSAGDDGESDGRAHRYHSAPIRKNKRIFPQVSFTKPDKKGKRHMVIEEEEPPPKLSIGDDVYIDSLIEKYGTNYKRAFQATVEEQPGLKGNPCSTAAIKLRLVKHRASCNIHTLACEVPMCGRSFNDIEVLAFHLSYAHQDISHSNNTTCYVCGFQLNSAKGKVAHLTSRHKKTAADHNLQCMEQREPVISPFAPAAIRLATPQRVPTPEEEIVYDNTTLSDICDIVL